MMKKLNIITVCGLGFGTSLMVFMSIQDIGKKYGVKVTGEATDVGSYKGKKTDLIVASSEIANKIKDVDVDVIGIDNLIDLEEIETKMKPYFENL